MSNRWMVTMAAVGAALLAPAALAISRPTSTHAVGADGSVYYVARSEGAIIRVGPDGASEVVANGLNAPSGVALYDDEYLKVGDEVGVHLVDLEERTIRVLSTMPSEFQPEVRFHESLWRYRGRTVKVVFYHNLQDQPALFDVEASLDGGRTWEMVASRTDETSFVWRAPEGSPRAARFRVTAFVDDQLVASDVSDWYETAASMRMAR